VRSCVAALSCLFAAMHLVATPIAACAQGTSPSLAGQWEGVARTPGNGALRVVITLDSTSAGWTGTLLVPTQTSQPFAFVSITRVQDSLILRLPATAQNGVLRIAPSRDGKQLAGIVQSGSVGTIVAMRAGTAEAAALVAGAARVEQSRAAATRLAETTAAASPPATNPDSAHLVTSDIRLFWNAIDRAPADSLAEYLQREYLERASVGVRDFIPGRIMSAEDLAVYVRNHRATYDSVRAANLDVSLADAPIRAAFHKLKDLYPDAVFPDVYFVIGRFNSGGTSTKHGLLIGAEMYRDPAALPGIVAHELIHFQQHYPSPRLLEHSFMEGTADFLGEMIAGKQINNDAHRYGMAHEAELWKEFSAHFDDTNFFPWMYGRPADGKPNDLGYFIGYRIAQAYYNKAPDKRQAIRDIVTARGGNVREVLTMSGYGPGVQPSTLPTFDRVLLLESTSETSANASIGDVNGDGHLDIVLAKGRHWPLVDRVLLGDGRGHFAAGYDLGTASDRSYSGHLADVDRDGDLDVIISNDRPDPKLVYLNHGTGHFRVGSTFGRPEWSTRNATVADLDGDGYPDIVVANRGDKNGSNYICFNKGGRFDSDCVAFARGRSRSDRPTRRSEWRKARISMATACWTSSRSTTIREPQPRIRTGVSRDPVRRQQGHRLRFRRRGSRW
jgi:hypothetical protein